MERTPSEGVPDGAKIDCALGVGPCQLRCGSPTHTTHIHFARWGSGLSGRRPQDTHLVTSTFVLVSLQFTIGDAGSSQLKRQDPSHVCDWKAGKTEPLRHPDWLTRQMRICTHPDFCPPKQRGPGGRGTSRGRSVQLALCPWAWAIICRLGDGTVCSFDVDPPLHSTELVRWLSPSSGASVFETSLLLVGDGHVHSHGF